MIKKIKDLVDKKNCADAGIRNYDLSEWTDFDLCGIGVNKMLLTAECQLRTLEK